MTKQQITRNIKSFQNYEKNFNDFIYLDKIIQKNRTLYKNGLMTIEHYYQLLDNIENFKKAIMYYWENI